MNTDRPDTPPVNDPAAREACLRRWLNAFTPVRELGRLLDAPAFAADYRPDAPRRTRPAPRPRHARLRLLPLARFLAAARALLRTDDETVRSRLEHRLLRLAEPLHAAGLFDLVELRHRAMQRMIDDHVLRASAGPAARDAQAR